MFGCWTRCTECGEIISADQVRDGSHTCDPKALIDIKVDREKLELRDWLVPDAWANRTTDFLRWLNSR